MIYPKKELLRLTSYNKDGSIEYIITQKNNQELSFSLYIPEGDKFKKLYSGDSPSKLERKLREAVK